MSDFENEVHRRTPIARFRVIDSFYGKRVAVDQIVQVLPEISTRRYTGTCLGAGHILSGPQNTGLFLRLDSGALVVIPSTSIRTITTVRGGRK